MEIANRRTHTPTSRDVYVGRPSPLGNPYSHQPGTKAEHMVGSREEAINAYRSWLVKKVATDKAICDLVYNLKEDAILVCWCAPLPCHAEVIIDMHRWMHIQTEQKHHEEQILKENQ